MGSQNERCHLPFRWCFHVDLLPSVSSSVKSTMVFFLFVCFFTVSLFTLYSNVSASVHIMNGGSNVDLNGEKGNLPVHSELSIQAHAPLRTMQTHGSYLVVVFYNTVRKNVNAYILK